MGYSAFDDRKRPAWNAGRRIGAKRALKQKEVWAIRFWLEQEGRLRDRALFDLAIDSKLRGCDLVRVRIGDLVTGDIVRERALVVQRKTGRPVQFEILEPARTTLLTWLQRRKGAIEDYAFPSRCNPAVHLSTRQYGRLVDEWVTGVGLKRGAPRGSWLEQMLARKPRMLVTVALANKTARIVWALLMKNENYRAPVVAA